MSLKAFLRQNAKLPENEKIQISERFIGEDGQPILWELRALTEHENAIIKDSSMIHTIKKGRRLSNMDTTRYLRRLCAASVVFPDLDNAELQASYNVVGSDRLMEEMLLPGEYAELMQTVNRINGFNSEALDEAKEEVKNS